MIFLLVLKFIKCLWGLIGLFSDYHNSGDKMGHPMDVPGFGLKSSFKYLSTPKCTVVVVHENPWWLLSNHLVLNLFSCVTYAVTAYIWACHSKWPIIYWACSCHDKSQGALAPCSSRYASRASRSLQELSSSHVTSPNVHLTCNSKSLLVHLWANISSMSYSWSLSFPKS